MESTIQGADEKKEISAEAVAAGAVVAETEAGAADAAADSDSSDSDDDSSDSEGAVKFAGTTMAQVLKEYRKRLKAAQKILDLPKRQETVSNIKEAFDRRVAEADAVLQAALLAETEAKVEFEEASSFLQEQLDRESNLVDGHCTLKFNLGSARKHKMQKAKALNDAQQEMALLEKISEKQKEKALEAQLKTEEAMEQGNSQDQEEDLTAQFQAAWQAMQDKKRLAAALKRSA